MVKLKVIDCPEPIKGWKQQVVSWVSWDGYNEVKHGVVSPVYREDDQSQKTEALREFGKIMQDQLLKFPPGHRSVKTNV